MSQLAPLRQKIRLIQTTKKITHAVRLVSMSFYNKLDKLNAPISTYAENVKSCFLDVLAHAPEWKSDLLFPDDAFDSRPLFIIISTSKGLCGSLNSNLIRYMESSLFIEKTQAPHFITIGQKATTFIKEKDFGEIICSYTEVNSHNFLTLADDLIDKVSNSGFRYSSVSFFSSVAKSFFAQMPSKFTLIPMSLDPIMKQGVQEAEALEGTEPIWEQTQEEILEHLSIRYLRSSIINILFQAIRAEHAARFLAMENSTNNAEKYLERLTLQFNKMRQALITKEVSELSASFPVR